MKVLITGKLGLANALYDAHEEDTVICVSRSNGHDIALVESWGSKFLDYDIVYNCAYDGINQLSVLEFFYSRWKNDVSKSIINIGSRVTYFPRSENKQEYWDYKIHKQTLQSAFEQMVITAKCDIKLINPGPVNTALVAHLWVPKLDPAELAMRIKSFVRDNTIKRVDLWA
jgi:hypothetical protein